MNGGAIQSNLIESKNSLVKRYLQSLGLKNIYQADYLLGANLYARGDMEECPWNEDITNYSVRTTLGFNNMLMFFSPDISKIEVNWNEKDLKNSKVSKNKSKKKIKKIGN